MNSKTTESGILFERTIYHTPGPKDWLCKEDITTKFSEGKTGNLHQYLEKEMMSQMALLHYDFSQHFLKMLSNTLQIKNTFQKISQMYVTEPYFNKAFKCPVLQNDFMSKKSHCFSILASKGLSSLLLSRLAGTHYSDNEEKEPTSLEKTMLNSFFEEFFTTQKDFFGPSFSMETAITQTHYGIFKHPEAKQVNNVYSVYATTFLFKNTPQTLYWVYSINDIKKIFALSSPPVKKKNVLLKPKTLEKIKVPITPLIGKSNVLMKDLLKLVVNDVIKVETKLSDKISVRIGDNVILKGQLGIYKEKLGLQVLDISSYAASIPDHTTPSSETQTTGSSILDKDNIVSNHTSMTISKETAVEKSISPVTPIPTPSPLNTEISEEIPLMVDTRTIEPDDRSIDEDEVPAWDDDESSSLVIEDESLPLEISSSKQKDTSTDENAELDSEDDFNWDDLDGEI